MIAAVVIFAGVFSIALSALGSLIGLLLLSYLKRRYPNRKEAVDEWSWPWEKKSPPPKPDAERDLVDEWRKAREGLDRH